MGFSGFASDSPYVKTVLGIGRTGRIDPDRQQRLGKQMI
jgi:hypothetical protein